MISAENKNVNKRQRHQRPLRYAMNIYSEKQQANRQTRARTLVSLDVCIISADNFAFSRMSKFWEYIFFRSSAMAEASLF